MAVVANKKVGVASFRCPWCSRRHRRTLWVPKWNPDGGPPASRFTCACGADLLVLGEPVYPEICWLNREKMLLQAWLRLKPKLRPAQGGYYDLVRVPHGHLPVTKVFLWRRLPIPVREIRDGNYFRCPECGSKSFFKPPPCRVCISRNEELYRIDFDRWFREADQRAAKAIQHERRDYFRRFWKQLECFALPLLVLAGRAWYVRSMRS